MTKVSEQVREVAGIVHTEDYSRVASQESGSGMFAQFAGLSFAGKADVGEGMEAKTESIKPKFTKAADPNMPEQPELIATNTSAFKGPKVI